MEIEISVKEKLILMGMKQIERHGFQEFSLRKVANECGVSCSAPYKHFKGKRDLISEIILYINKKWYIRQAKVIKKYENDYRMQLTQISLEYIRFLVENSYFRSIIMLKDEDIDQEHIKAKSEMSKYTKEIIDKYCKFVNMDEKSKLIKTFIVRSFIYGAALMFDNGELEYNEENFNLISKAIEREFDLK